MKSQLLDNKLFFICPFCQVEHFIRRQFGNVYFVTAPASIFSFEDETFVSEVRELIVRRRIDKVYFVCDLECNFLKNAFLNSTSHGLLCESVIQNLKNNNDDSLSLSKKIIWNQIVAIENKKSIFELVIKNQINIHGIISSKKENKLIQII